MGFEGFRIVNDIEILEHIWIEMSDGIRLSAKVWLPANSENQPVPAILEFIPYRKRDAYAFRDHQNHAWMAAKGYACIRPDMRGHGDSEGIMFDEYSPREQQDAVEVIDWIANQKWCSGNVGMMGLSWGGIASLQAASKQPNALKAIIPVGASVDRYYDDGGYLIGGYPGQGLGWGGVMFGYCIRPPDPAVVGDSWRNMWFERLKKTPMFAEKWLTHQIRDETWKQGSICEDFDKIKVPVLGVSGWNDCWPNTILRLLENVDAPCRMVSGAWAHVFPNLGGPGPLIGFLQLSLDWWDHWLKGINNGVMDKPALIAFLQDSHAPDPNPSSRPGRWVIERAWPTKNVSAKRLVLRPGILSEDVDEPSRSVNIFSPLGLGLKTGEYMPISGPAELPQDQRSDDAHSVCFDHHTLTKPLDLLGTTKVYLRLSSDCTCGVVAARLCDVAPDGASTLISYGILNLKQRNGREVLTKITPGESLDVVIRLNDTGWSLKPNHKLRLALSSQLWPMAWPLAERATLTLDLANCYLDLPIRTSNASDEIENPFGPPVAADQLAHETILPAKATRHVHNNIEKGEIVYKVKIDGGKTKFTAIDLTYGFNSSQKYTIVEGDPLSACIEYESGFSFQRGDWDVKTKSELIATCNASDFILKARILGFENDQQVFVRDWDVKIPRLIF